MEYISTYGPYNELVEKGTQTIYTNQINSDNIISHFDSIISILQDGIETDFVQSMKITVVFSDDTVVLSIFDYLFNLMFWTVLVGVNKPIMSYHIFYFEDITQKNVKRYLDYIFVRDQRTKIDFKRLNNIIDVAIGCFRKLSQFQPWLANTVNFEDTIELMKKYPEFNDTIHLDVSNIPLEDVKNKGMEAAQIQVKYIKNGDHCLKDSFRTGEAINIKQYKEVAVNIGSKPDGTGGVFPKIINHSFMNGGLTTPEELCIESSVGRLAQIIEKGNVGKSGAFARRLGLNNQDTFIHPDPHYSCNTKNFEVVKIKNKDILDIYDMRYYRFNPNDIDRKLNALRDTHLIGKTLYFRSPMTCDSAAKGEGICYKCYGDLAYVNKDINCGQIASELLSSIYTQTLLSAKHLLESKVIKIKWSEGFNEWFNVTYNSIGLYDNKNYAGAKLLIPVDIQNDDELDDMSFSDYIFNFKVKSSDNNIIDIYTADQDEFYIHPDLMRIIEQSPVEDDYTVIDMTKLIDIPSLFIINFRNSELSRTMKQIKNIIDVKTTIKDFNRNNILEAFIDINLEGGIKLNAVHFEVLLMNQIRAEDNILEKPDWSNPGEGCRLLALKDAMANNLSISIRLQNDKISKAFMNPDNSKLYRPSNMDVYFMIKPQEFLSNKDLISNDYKLKNDVESNLRNPIRHITK